MSPFRILLLIHCAVHLYLFARIYPVLRGRWWSLAAAGCVLALLLASFFVARALEERNHLISATVVSWVAYIWLAIVFWSLFFGLMLELYNLVMLAGAHWQPPLRRLMLSPRTFLMVLGGIVGLLTLWGLIEARMVRVRELTVQTAKWPRDTPPIRVLLIADVHLSLVRGGDLLDKIGRFTNELQPDLIVSTGDMLDGQAERLNSHAARLAEIEAPRGKFAVLGNHEFYVGEETSVKFHEAAGFEVLRGEGVNVGEHLRIAGVDDPAIRRRGADGGGTLDDLTALGEADAGRFTLMLKHQPLIAPEAPGKFDVQLSGHTHGGQIFPFGWLVKMRYPYFRGLYALGADGGEVGEEGDRAAAYVYVSPGTGTWAMPLRVLARPEVTLLTIGAQAEANAPPLEVAVE